MVDGLLRTRFVYHEEEGGTKKTKKQGNTKQEKTKQMLFIVRPNMIKHTLYFLRALTLLWLLCFSTMSSAMSLKLEDIYQSSPEDWAEIQADCKGQQPATEAELQKLFNALNDSGEPRYTDEEMDSEQNKRPMCLLIRMWVAAAYVDIEKNLRKSKSSDKMCPGNFILPSGN